MPGETIEVKGYYKISEDTLKILEDSLVSSVTIEKLEKIKDKEFIGKDSFEKALIKAKIMHQDLNFIMSFADIKGIVYIDGKVLKDEFYIKEHAQYEMPPIKIPANNLFMLGDNRNNSMDSHVWGTLPMKNVIGHAIIRFWPPQRIGKLD